MPVTERGEARQATNVPAPAGTFAWVLAGGMLLGGGVFVVGFFGGLALYRGSNLAPILGIFLGPPAFLVGLGVGALVARLRGWDSIRRFLLLAGVAAVAGLGLLGYMWNTRSQDDSEVLAERINGAAKQLHRSGEVLLFQPPREAGPYTLSEEGAGGLTVEYPQTPKGGHNWGQGRSWGHSQTVGVPVNLKVEKAAGEPTEIVLRKTGGKIELVELR